MGGDPGRLLCCQMSPYGSVILGSLQPSQNWHETAGLVSIICYMIQVVDLFKKNEHPGLDDLGKTIFELPYGLLQWQNI